MIDETVEEIADMQTHSSSVVAVKAASALSELTDRDFPAVEEYLRALERNSSALQRANPSHASLHNTQQEILERVRDDEPESVAQAQALTTDVIDDVVHRVEAAKHRAAENCAALLADGETLLIHDYSSTVLESIELAIGDGRSFSVYVSEARPRYLGRKMARTLSALDGVDTTLIVDSATGHFLSDCDRVLLGMDCIVDGTLYNRIGTYPIAATAAHADVPVTVVGAAAKLVDSGFAFENEQRSRSEVMREPAEGFTVENPAYDGTPVELVDLVVTDDGETRY